MHCINGVFNILFYVKVFVKARIIEELAKNHLIKFVANGI